MAFKKTQRKKAQAAIEFLMTYGWMLLVVLIVGALIFSFVDFGSLLPKSVDFTSSAIRGDPQSSNAYSKEATVDNNSIFIGFTYTGNNRATITNDSTTKVTDTITNTDCPSTTVYNEDTKENSTATTNVPFLNGQRGTIKFECPSGSLGLIQGDAFEGEINIGYTDSKRQSRVISNKGSIRLPIE